MINILTKKVFVSINYHNIQSNIKMLLGRDCEVEKVMRFLKDVGEFDEI